jgi:hypothetical protein
MARAAAVRSDKRVKVKVEQIREASKRRRTGPSPAEERNKQHQDQKEAHRKAAVEASQTFSPTKIKSGYEKQKELVRRETIQ